MSRKARLAIGECLSPSFGDLNRAARDQTVPAVLLRLSGTARQVLKTQPSGARSCCGASVTRCLPRRVAWLSPVPQVKWIAQSCSVRFRSTSSGTLEPPGHWSRLNACNRCLSPDRHVWARRQLRRGGSQRMGRRPL